MPTLNWAGKDKVVNHHLDVPMRVLEKVYGFDANGRHVGGADSGNMIIHGDNLAALKALLPRYEGRVDCIYIDPPYNTGNEGWIYNDNVNDPQIQRWLGEVVGREGEDFSRHDKWLCMMYPRLRLLRKLLARNGYIFISISFPYEASHLRLICDEIFGSQNFVGELTWESTTQPANAGSAKFGLQQKVEPILCYIKDRKAYHGFYLEKTNTEKKYPHMGKYGACRFEIIEKSDAGGYKRDSMKFKILGQSPRSGKRWQIGEALARELERMGKLEIVDGVVKRAVYPEDEDDKESYVPFWSHFGAKDFGTAENGKNDLNEMMGYATGFDTVKLVGLIQSILNRVCTRNSIILDSFAGSATTAHAVLKMNAADGGNRRFILVELMDYAESITAERVKRVIGGYGTGERAVAGTGGSFDFFELGPALMERDALNEELPVERIREYVWWTETRQAPGAADPEDPYLLGVKDGTAYYFCYERGRAVALNRALLRKLRTKAESYVVFADTCLLDEVALRRLRIAFKKIPRDIARP